MALDRSEMRRFLQAWNSTGFRATYIVCVCAFASGLATQSSAQPKIASFTPPSTAAAGSTLVITGTGFKEQPPAGSVTFTSAAGTVSATDIQSWHDTSITVTIPNVVPGIQSVVVSDGSNSDTGSLNVSLPSIPFTAAPQVITPTNGKLPASVNLSVIENACDNKRGVGLTQGNAPYTIVVSGAGILPSAQTPGRCSINATLGIDPNTPPGSYQITVQDKDHNPVGTAQIAVMDASAGPIPPGLAPQVDVMWEVMSQKNCSDAFGARVAQSKYCIDVKIGNNSGYALQVAGIGFKNYIDDKDSKTPVTIANSTYASTRAVLLTSMVTNGRNIAYNVLQATGVLMAGFTPYFGTGKHPNGTVNNARTNWTTAASIVSGPLLSAFNIVAPNPVITQLNNLDDQSFRDNKVIPNNSHVSTIVFVEKQALTYQLDALANRYSLLNSPTKSTEKDHGGSINQSGSTSAGTKMYAATINNSMNNRHMISPSRGDFSPLLVKLALGSVVIVGDQIAYLNRVQIQSNAATTPGTSPLVALPANLFFPNQAMLNPSPAQTVVLTNTGSSALTNISPQPPAGQSDFIIAGNTCPSSLAPATSCALSIVFTPFPTVGAPVNRTATLQVSFSPSTGPITINLSGTTTVPSNTVVFGPPTLDFGAVKVNANASRTLTIANFQSGALTQLQVNPPAGTNPAEFVLASNTCGTRSTPVQLAVGANCSVTYTFTPTAAGGRQATITFSYQVNGATATTSPPVNLTGTGQ